MGDAVVVSVVGELDASTATEFRRKLCGLVESVIAGNVVLDMSRLDFLDVASVRVIEKGRAAAAARGRALWVDGLHGGPARLLELLGLESLADPVDVQGCERRSRGRSE
ncbi:MAG: STAS domain-containing protein [Pseudonocardia sp.]